MDIESMEEEHEKKVPSWNNQITVRAVLTSLILSVHFIFIVCKLNLTMGVIPSLNVAAGLLGFAILKAYTSLLNKFGLLKQPFTRQEKTVIQTCVVASSGIAFSSCTASYLLGMSAKIATQADEGNTPNNVNGFSLGWMIAFLFAVSLVGLFSIVPIRKMMILKYKLKCPSGTSTAYLINTFYTLKGAKLAKKQVRTLSYAFCGSFAKACTKWFFEGTDGCGLSSRPLFALKAFNQRFYMDGSLTYIGVGMICPYMVNISLLIGGIISWGIMWPAIESKKGHWYSDKLSASSLHGIQGYRIFLAIAMMLGDGLFHFSYMLIATGQDLYSQHYSKTKLSTSKDTNSDEISSYEENGRQEYFLKDQIPNKFAIAGYLILSIVSIIVVPILFYQIKWYQVMAAYIIVPVIAFCNVYGCGVTDWSLTSNYGKIAIIIFSMWASLGQGGVIAGLVSCGVMMSIVATASDLMQDFKTGYLTLASPCSTFFSQVIGTAMGCVISPLVFWFFYKAYDLGNPEGPYPAPYAQMYQGIALLGVEGTSALPKHCLTVAIGFFFAAVFINVVHGLLKKFETKYRIHRFIPSPMCMAIPFYLEGYFTIDVCLGSLILFLSEKLWKKKAQDFASAVASGFICGESFWGVLAAILSLAGLKPPICKFLSSA